MTLQERFAANLRALRECYGETQEELALALHLSKTAVSNYECGARMPGSDILLALAEHFMIPVDDLLQQELSPIVADHHAAAAEDQPPVAHQLAYVFDIAHGAPQRKQLRASS